jgi:hypothetical protein
MCAGASVQIGLLPIADPNITYNWTPITGLSNSTVANPIASPTASTVYTLLISNGLCTDTVTQAVTINSASINAGNDTTVCGPNATVTLHDHRLSMEHQHAVQRYAQHADHQCEREHERNTGRDLLCATARQCVRWL